MQPDQHHKPFADPPDVDQRTLRAYAAGELDAQAAQAVERALEADPLLADAAEGLAMPDAAEALAGLEAHRPGPTCPARLLRWLVLPLLFVLLGGWLVVSVLMDRTADTELPEDHAMLLTAPDAFDEPPALELALTATELATVEELPETLQIGHRNDERHTLGMQEQRTVLQRERLERLGGQPVDATGLSAPPAARPGSAPRSSRQLVYLHDLLVVHPDELHPRRAEVDMLDRHIPARHADRQALDAERTPIRTMAYLPFMEMALGRFVRNDHIGCLADLTFLLEQYPDDVNALFYGGLCAYNLGLYDRALRQLQRTATHPVDSFDEEAAWYHALTLERAGQPEAAQQAFARIAEGGGFYAERARSRLVTQ